MSLHDFAEFIRILNQRRARYLIVGGYAVAFHGHPRATDDVDVLIASDEKTIRRVERALVDFVGVAPRPESLRSPRGMIRIGGPRQVEGLEVARSGRPEASVSVSKLPFRLGAPPPPK